jgi:hypothetical protein
MNVRTTASVVMVEQQTKQTVIILMLTFLITLKMEALRSSEMSLRLYSFYCKFLTDAGQTDSSTLQTPMLQAYITRFQ